MKGYIAVHMVRVKLSVSQARAERERKFGSFGPPDPFKEEDMEQQPLDVRAANIFSIMPPSAGLTPPGVGCFIGIPTGEYMLAESRDEVHRLIAAAETDG